MKAYIRLLRPKHCIKNILVMLPLVFSGQLFEPRLLGQAVCAFLAFCALASLVYIINDIKDVERDRQHPTKCRRPIASGAVPVSHAVVEAVVVGGVLVGLAVWGRFSWESWLCLGAYFVLNLGYSMGLKHVPILDIAILVSGFLLRVLLGSAVTGIAHLRLALSHGDVGGLLYGPEQAPGELRTSSASTRPGAALL